MSLYETRGLTQGFIVQICVDVTLAFQELAHTGSTPCGPMM